MRREKSLSCYALLVLCLPCVFFTAAAYCDVDEITEIDPTDDAYVYDGAPNTNYDNMPEATYLRVGDYYGSSKICRSYLKFDLTRFQYHHINTATLKLEASGRGNDLCVEHQT
jgi:hypothetical protein